ncbi:hypothetical protein KIH39_23970 [Telmatocola sphagniphila]|jgi:hypothetical protein|uniref:Helix-turn-helix domain-containing protein n=1 Tax=Telmatocola sphagniphila TaxID=1123043 RepID=A0A8E6B4N6_9BACT|nr:hypothetical protein [Telmatocola sphagniphila]QVL31857.1 hypothetical protein KIH39_23970 [Telmatocola sphagniphila]
MVQLEAYILDSLLPDLVGHDRRSSSFIVYLYLYRLASQQPNWAVKKSHQAIALATGLSRSSVQSSLTHLQSRQLIHTTRANPTAVPQHRVNRPWLRLTSRKN